MSNDSLKCLGVEEVFGRLTKGVLTLKDFTSWLDTKNTASYHVGFTDGFQAGETNGYPVGFQDGFQASETNGYKEGIACAQSEGG
jgi:hypothetical protein